MSAQSRASCLFLERDVWGGQAGETLQDSVARVSMMLGGWSRGVLSVKMPPSPCGLKPELADLA